MGAHRDEAVAVARTVTGLNEEDESKEYDLLMPGLSRDGRFDKEAIPRIGRSFVELKLLDHEPEMAKLYTEEFLPEGLAPLPAGEGGTRCAATGG
jgi:hypothetical protein